MITHPRRANVCTWCSVPVRRSGFMPLWRCYFVHLAERIRRWDFDSTRLDKVFRWRHNFHYYLVIWYHMWRVFSLIFIIFLCIEYHMWRVFSLIPYFSLSKLMKILHPHEPGAFVVTDLQVVSWASCKRCWWLSISNDNELRNIPPGNSILRWTVFWSVRRYASNESSEFWFHR